MRLSAFQRRGDGMIVSMLARKGPARKNPTPDVENSVLIRSARRCALCFHLDRDTRQRRGQIAHLDRRRSNSIEDNLAFLCLDHHTDYDSTTSQHKNYTIDEVKTARSALYKWVKKGMPPLGSRTRNMAAGATPHLARRPAIKTVSHAPEIVLDYSYAENSKDHHDANCPLVLRNVSSAFPAYNIEVLPLEIGQASAAFEPHLIPYIEPEGTRNVFANTRSGSPLFKRRLPDFLLQSYRDESVGELFGTKTFALRVRYQGTGSTVFETQCELLFRPWKKETKIGRIDRRVVSGEGPRSPRIRHAATSQLKNNRPKVSPFNYGASQNDRREGLHLTNEGTPAHDVRIETIILRDGWSVRFDEISGPLERPGFSQAWVSCGNNGSTTLDAIWLDLNKSSEMPAIFPLIITYKDFDGWSNRSVCEPHRNVLKPSGFDVKFIRQERIEREASSSLAPILSYEGITSGGDYAFTYGPHNLQVVTIRNTQLAVKNTANNVKASVEYNHAGGNRFIVRDALWIVDGRRWHVVNLSGNEAQRLVLLSRAKDQTLFASFDENYIGRDLEVGHWNIRIMIAGDNCDPLVLEGGFTILPDEKRLVYDQPALRVSSSTH